MVWVAYYSDGSQYGLYPTEIAALRQAVDSHRNVKAVALPCDDLREELASK